MSYPFPSAVVVAFLATALLLPATTYAQYEEINVYAGYTQNVNRIMLHDKWEPGWGPEVVLGTPFYLGSLEAAVAYHQYGTRVNDVPRFNALMIQAGWRLGIEPLSWIRLEGGLRIGNYGMQFFSDNGRERAELNESERILGLQSRATVRLYGPWALSVSSVYQRVFTRIPMDFVYVSVGLNRRLSTPGWLRDFLR